MPRQKKQQGGELVSHPLVIKERKTKLNKKNLDKFVFYCSKIDKYALLRLNKKLDIESYISPETSQEEICSIIKTKLQKKTLSKEQKEIIDSRILEAAKEELEEIRDNIKHVHSSVMSDKKRSSLIKSIDKIVQSLK